MGSIYAVLYDEPSQTPIVKAVCFGTCGQIIIGSLTIPLDEYVLVALTCRQEDCPALDKQMEEPCGSVDGEPIYLRKLKAPEGAAL